MTDIKTLTADSAEPQVEDYESWNDWALAKAHWAKLVREAEQVAAGEAKVAAIINPPERVDVRPPAPPAFEPAAEPEGDPYEGQDFDYEPTKDDEAAINAAIDEAKANIPRSPEDIEQEAVHVAQVQQEAAEQPAPKTRKPRTPKAAPEPTEVEDLLDFFSAGVVVKTAVELWRDEQKANIRTRARFSAAELATFSADIVPVLKTLRRFVEQAEKVIDTVPDEVVEDILAS